MGIFFSKKKKEAKHTLNEKDRAVLELKRQRDRLRKYQNKMRDVIEKETGVARELLKQGRKDRALLVLRKKKYQQQMLEKTDGQLLNIEEMVESIEFAHLQKKVFEALEKGSESLQRINSEIDIDDVEKMMSDTAEALAYQDEVSNMLGGSLTSDDEVDVEKEYESLQLEMMGDELADLPTVPDTKLQTSPAEVEAEPAAAVVVPEASSSKAEVVMA